MLLTTLALSLGSSVIRADGQTVKQTISANSYVNDANGNSVYSGDFVQNGETFSIDGSRLGVSEADRESLSLGVRLRGELSDSVSVEGNVSVFDILQDEGRSSALNPNDVEYSPAGEVTSYDDTGWRTAEVKLNIDNIGATGLSLVTGLRHEAYELNFDVYDSTDWSAGSQSALADSSGGKTEVNAVFVQLNWDISERWDASLGGRYESFESREGYFANDDEATPGLDLTATPGTSRDQFSPKFSLGFSPAGDNWQLRYSFGRAYRFPIVEELFSQFSAFNAESISNPELKPEDATAHNFMIDRNIAEGYMRVNVLSETVEDVIESQLTTLPGGISIRTFVPIDKVKTEGVEFIVNQRGMFIDKLDVRFNVAYTDSEILNNSADPSIEGNRYPRMPKWRANLLATYNVTPRWDVGANLQYASDSFGRTDNTDTANQVYGAQDGYTRIGLKTGWRVNKAFSLGLGVDNLSNEISYVAHPWPGRTWYGSISYDL